MAERFQITDEKIQDYIDGRLSARDQSAMAAYLLAHPDIAAEIQTMRQQDEALKGFRADILTQPVPERLTAIVDAAKAKAGHGQARWAPRRMLRMAAAAVVIFAVGAAAGWFQRDLFDPPMDTEKVALMTARDAFLMHADQKDYPIEFPAAQETGLRQIFERAFHRPIGRPALNELGYRFMGGKLLPSAKGQLGFYLFQNAQGQRMALFLWPSEKAPKTLSLVDNDDVCTRFWRRDGLGFAVVSDRGNQTIEDVTGRIQQYYRSMETPISQ